MRRILGTGRETAPFVFARLIMHVVRDGGNLSTLGCALVWRLAAARSGSELYWWIRVWIGLGAAVVLTQLRINVMACFTRHKLVPVAALFGTCGSRRWERCMLRTRLVCALLAATGAWILATTTDAATWDG